MQVAIVVYPGFTALDVLGPYEVLGRLPDTEVVFVAENAGPVRNDLGSLTIEATATFEDVTRPDVVLVGGDDEAQTVQLIIEYAPEPPYTAGSPTSAPATVLDRAVRELSA